MSLTNAINASDLIDRKSYILGMITAFAECVTNECKKIALVLKVGTVHFVIKPEGFAMEQIISVLESGDTYFWATHAGAELDLLVKARCSLNSSD